MQMGIKSVYWFQLQYTERFIVYQLWDTPQFILVVNLGVSVFYMTLIANLTNVSKGQ
jgi:hypothetical protein